MIWSQFYFIYLLSILTNSERRGHRLAHYIGQEGETLCWAHMAQWMVTGTLVTLAPAEDFGTFTGWDSARVLLVTWLALWPEEDLFRTQSGPGGVGLRTIIPFRWKCLKMFFLALKLGGLGTRQVPCTVAEGRRCGEMGNMWRSVPISWPWRFSLLWFWLIPWASFIIPE